MTDHAHSHNLPIHDALHPLIYRAMLALTAWLVLSIWVLFGSAGSYVGLIFAMVTLFFVIVTGIPLLIWQTWRRNADRHDTAAPSERFRNWTSDGFATWTGNLSGREAATQILLPLAAVSIGMTVFGLVYYFDALSAGYY
jgi:hypothetical protein